MLAADADTRRHCSCSYADITAGEAAAGEVYVEARTRGSTMAGAEAGEGWCAITGNGASTSADAG